MDVRFKRAVEIISRSLVDQLWAFSFCLTSWYKKNSIILCCAVCVCVSLCWIWITWMYWHVLFFIFVSFIKFIFVPMWASPCFPWCFSVRDFKMLSFHFVFQYCKENVNKDVIFCQCWWYWTQNTHTTDRINIIKGNDVIWIFAHVQHGEKCTSLNIYFMRY